MAEVQPSSPRKHKKHRKAEDGLIVEEEEKNVERAAEHAEKKEHKHKKHKKHHVEENTDEITGEEHIPGEEENAKQGHNKKKHKKHHQEDTTAEAEESQHKEENAMPNKVGPKHGACRGKKEMDQNWVPKERKIAHVATDETQTNPTVSGLPHQKKKIIPYWSYNSLKILWCMI